MKTLTQIMSEIVNCKLDNTNRDEDNELNQNLKLMSTLIGGNPFDWFYGVKTLTAKEATPFKQWNKLDIEAKRYVIKDYIHTTVQDMGEEKNEPEYFVYEGTIRVLEWNEYKVSIVDSNINSAKRKIESFGNEVSPFKDYQHKVELTGIGVERYARDKDRHAITNICLKGDLIVKG